MTPNEKEYLEQCENQIRHLQQQLKEKDEKIEYWKQLAEATHKLIDHTGWGNTADWEKYESLKNQKPTT